MQLLQQRVNHSIHYNHFIISYCLLTIRYDRAIEIYSQLPRSQYQTGWVFAQLGNVDYTNPSINT
jgi:hypothetical protein